MGTIAYSEPVEKTPLEKYKDKVIEYQKRLIELHKSYGDYGMNNPMEIFDTVDWNDINEWSKAFTSMEEILGLSGEEADAIWDECKSVSGLIETWKEEK